MRILRDKIRRNGVLCERGRGKGWMKCGGWIVEINFLASPIFALCNSAKLSKSTGCMDCERNIWDCEEGGGGECF